MTSLKAMSSFLKQPEVDCLTRFPFGLDVGQENRITFFRNSSASALYI